MTLPKTIDYDPVYDETIVTSGVTGMAPRWIGFNLDSRIMHIVADEGVVAADGKSLETITRKGVQVSLDGQDVIDFYQANSEAMDSIVQAAIEKWMSVEGKTGTVKF
jgi:hypothetical protein